MGTQYRLDIHSAAGTPRSQLIGSADSAPPGARAGFLELAYSRKVNEPGQLTFLLDGDNAAIAALEDRAIIKVWRRNAELGIPWYRDFTGLYLDQERTYTDHGLFKASCPGALWLLGTRYILYFAGVANRTMFTGVAAETIMKMLIDYNASANATVANGRMRTPNTLGITIAGDLGLGTVRSWACTWDNLLTSLQDLARVGGGDFDLVNIGGAAWEFRFYPGQLGTDRSAGVTFAHEYGNMRTPVYKRTRNREATVAVVGADGVGAARNITVRTGTDYSVTNDIEIFVNDTNATTATARQASGDKALRERQAEHEFSFDVIQEGARIYGRDYFLGDLVRARYDVIEVTRKIAGIAIGWKPGGEETVSVEMSQV